MTPPLHHFELQKCAFRDARTTLLFVRLVERMRRVIAHEYGLPLWALSPVQTFVSCFVGEQEKQGGLHADESSFSCFHYSCVMYLSTQGDDFEGGSFAFDDPPAEEGGSRVLTPVPVQSGAAVIFSSGWENMHAVEPLASGTRFAVPTFFCTHAERPSGFAPADDAQLTAELWRTLLAPQSADDFRQFKANWHCMLAPSHD
eukprot:1037259-Prymnesium_polylepis.1